MARIRAVKPDFFRHEALQDLESKHPLLRPMLVFAGLWTQADKEGRFVWQPRLLKLDILPFLDFDMADTLAALETAEFVFRYEVDGKTYGQIPTFSEHQRFSGKESEAPGKHPAPSKKQPRSARVPGKRNGLGERNGLGDGDESPRKDELFEEIARECGIALTSLTKSARGELNACRKQLAEAGATPADIPIRARAFCARYQGATLTPSALAKHWPSLAPVGTVAADPAKAEATRRIVEASLAADRKRLET